MVPMSQQETLIKAIIDGALPVEKKGMEKIDGVSVQASYMYCCNVYNGMRIEARWLGTDKSAVVARQNVVPFPYTMTGIQDNETKDALKDNPCVRAALFVYCLIQGDKMGSRLQNGVLPVRPKLLDTLEDMMFDTDHVDNDMLSWCHRKLRESTDAYIPVYVLYDAYKVDMIARHVKVQRKHMFCDVLQQEYKDK
jgi:hypothetical protein